MSQSRQARFALVVGLALLLALVAAACGGGGDKTATTSAPAAEGSGAGAGTAGGMTVQVAFKDNAFDPKDISVPAGKEIVFELNNRGQAPHNMAVNVDGKDVVSQPDPTRAGAKGKLTVTFAKAGTYEFKCDYHPAEMKGAITVK